MGTEGIEGIEGTGGTGGTGAEEGAEDRNQATGESERHSFSFVLVFVRRLKHVS